MVEEPPPSSGVEKDVYNNIIIFSPVVIGFEKNPDFLPFSPNQLIPRFKRAFIEVLGAFGHTAYDGFHK